VVSFDSSGWFFRCSSLSSEMMELKAYSLSLLINHALFSSKVLGACALYLNGNFGYTSAFSFQT